MIGTVAAPLPEPARPHRSANARHWGEYLALRTALAALRVSGFRGAGAVGARIGRLGYWPIGIRRAVVERQVAAAFPELPAEDVQRVSRSSYAHLGRTTVETAMLDSFTSEDVLALVERVHGWTLLEVFRDRGRGLLLVGGHLGNWELGGAYLAARGLAVDAVARDMENPLFERYLTSTRERLGMSVVRDADAVRRIPRALRSGRAVAFLVDQGVAGLASTWVPFFGRLAKTPRGPAVFAIRMNAPIVFGACLRLPNGNYELFLEPIPVEPTGDLDQDVERIVASYTAALERHVRLAPEQYFWQHRRWKHQRPGTPTELGEP